MPAADMGVRIRAYLAAMPPAISGSNGSGATFAAAKAVVLGFGLSIDQARPYLKEYSQRCEPPWSDYELEHKLLDADANEKGLIRGYLLNGAVPESASLAQQAPVIKKEPEPVYDPAFLAQKASTITEDIDVAYLEMRSQFTCWNRTPVGFLHKVYAPGDHIWIATKYNSIDGGIWIHNGTAQRFDELDHLLTDQYGVWFLTAPIDGELHGVDRRKSSWNPEGLSFTVLEALCAWRFLLIESDVAPIPLWRKAVVQWPRPIISITSSGGVGDHVIIRVDAKSKDEFDRIAAQYDDELVKLGACKGSTTARRLSRLPNCMRGQTGRLQQLLYLRPDADGTPICQIPPREPPGAIEARIRATHAGRLHNYETPDL